MAAWPQGSLCLETDIARAQTLLDTSLPDKKHRYATDGERAFAGMEHAPNEWHGWPIGWKEVPEPLRRQWEHAGTVKRRHFARHWHQHVVSP